MLIIYFPMNTAFWKIQCTQVHSAVPKGTTSCSGLRMAGCRAHNEVEAEKLTCEIVELENSIAHLVSLLPQELLGVFSSFAPLSSTEPICYPPYITNSDGFPTLSGWSCLSVVLFLLELCKFYRGKYN